MTTKSEFSKGENGARGTSVVSNARKDVDERPKEINIYE